MPIYRIGCLSAAAGPRAGMGLYWDSEGFRGQLDDGRTLTREQLLLLEDRGLADWSDARVPDYLRGLDAPGPVTPDGSRAAEEVTEPAAAPAGKGKRPRKARAAKEPRAARHPREPKPPKPPREPSTRGFSFSRTLVIALTALLLMLLAGLAAFAVIYQKAGLPGWGPSAAPVTATPSATATEAPAPSVPATAPVTATRHPSAARTIAGAVLNGGMTAEDGTGQARGTLTLLVSGERLSFAFGDGTVFRIGKRKVTFSEFQDAAAGPGDPVPFRATVQDLAPAAAGTLTGNSQPATAGAVPCLLKAVLPAP